MKGVFLFLAPCPPHTVDVEVNCSAGSMTVTWPANPDAESFHVRAETSGGAFLSCDSTSTSCSISGLSCGQSYSVTVTSVRGGCESRRSTAVNVTSGNLHNNAQQSIDMGCRYIPKIIQGQLIKNCYN